MTEESSKPRKKAPKRSLLRARERGRKALRTAARGALWLVLLPFRVLLLFWTLLTRFFLWGVTLALVLYFVVTTVVTGPLVLDLLNENLLGSFHADHMELSLLSARVQLFNLRITHPDGRDIIHARRTATSVDVVGLLAWGAKRAVGVSAPLPLHLRETEVDGYEVMLPFDESGFHFPEAFMPAVVTPDQEPSGPAPIITLSHVTLGEGRVLLDFSGWTMPIDVQRVSADLRIGGPEEFLLTARSIQVSSFQMLDLLPEPITFVGSEPSAVNVARFRMNLEALEVWDGRVVHPAFEGFVHHYSLEFARPGLPTQATGEVTLLSAERVAYVTFGHLFGAATVGFEMSGQAAMPDFKFRLVSDYLLAEGLPLEHIDGTATMDLHGGLFVGVSELTAELSGGSLELSDGMVEIEQGGAPEISFDACFEGMLPGVIATYLEVDELADYADLLASGCCHGCRINTGPDELRMDGGLSLAIDTGEAAALVGVAAGTLEAFVTWAGDTIRWEGLAITTDIGHLSSVGHVRLFPELSGRLELEGGVQDLGDIPLLGALGLGGQVILDELSVSGTLQQPLVRTRLSAWDVQVAGETFEHLALAGSLDGPGVELETFCFEHGENSGCLAGGVRLGDELAAAGLPMPVSLRIEQPMTVALDNLPFVHLPVTGLLTLENAQFLATVTTDLYDTLASLSGTAQLSVSDFALGDGALLVSSAALALTKEAGDGGRLGQVHSALSWERLSGDGWAVRSAELEALVDDVPGWRDWKSGFPLPVGEGSIEARNLEMAGNALSAIDLEFTSLAEVVSVDGAIDVARGARVGLRTRWHRAEESATLGVTLKDFPAASLPPAALPPSLRELFAETRVSADVALADLSVPALLTADWRALFNSASGSGELAVHGLESLPEPVRSVEARVSLSRGGLRFRPLDVALANGTRVHASGTFWPFRERADLTLSWTPTRLSSVRSFLALDLPLDGLVGGELSISGSLLAPELKASLETREFVAADIALGRAVVEIEGKVGQSLTIRSDQFFPGFSLDEGAISFSRALPESLRMAMRFTDFDIKRVLSSLPDMLQVKAGGSGQLMVRFLDGEPFALTIDVPTEELRACIQSDELSLCTKNPEPARLVVDSSGLDFQQVHIVGNGHEALADGRIGFVTGWDLNVGLSLDLARLPFLGEYLASYEGRVGTMKQSVRLVGPLENPSVQGELRLADVVLLPRQLGSEIAIPAAALQVTGGILDGNLLGWIEEDAPILGTYDEGSFRVYGWFRLAEWSPDAVLLNFAGKEIFYQSPGEFRLVLSPQVEFKVADLTGESGGEGYISGEVYVSEGEFTRNFDRLIGSFTTAFSRSQERYSKPITETLPFLKNLELALRVRGGNFAVSSRFPFGETELAVNMDLRVGGTLDELELNDWMRLVPGGTITYKVVKRVFSVTQGSVDFAGDPATPYIDIEAITEVPYSRPTGTGVALDLDEEAWGETIPIKIRLTGTYPNLKPEFSSDKPGFDDADLQTLLLLGMTRKDLEGRSQEGSKSEVSINLLTEDVASMVSNLLLAPFVDTVSLGFTQQGGILAEAATKIGRAISLSTRVRKDSEVEHYTAGIKFKITDRLSLEGRMKKYEDETDSQTLYEAKFKFLIPLD